MSDATTVMVVCMLFSSSIAMATTTFLLYPNFGRKVFGGNQQHQQNPQPNYNPVVQMPKAGPLKQEEPVCACALSLGIDRYGNEISPPCWPPGCGKK